MPDRAAAGAFYRDVSGLRVLSPPRAMAGNAIRDGIGELVSDPTKKVGRALERTCWFVDPRGVVFTLEQNSRSGRPYLARSGA
ncbi:hypothetical protein [Mycobacterium camsae]|uniref:hypothetical protein n=1 Tax=Mycobacterium gordonae TaxID=1778 RepID=UPI001F11DFEA|nr:hypothetical protein [Mycobacterium gordonae]